MSSSAAQEFSQLDLNALAKVTVRSFERLAPFSHLQASCVLAPFIVSDCLTHFQFVGRGHTDCIQNRQEGNNLHPSH